MARQSVDRRLRKTGTPGVVWRELADGGRSYSVRASRSKWVKVEGGYAEAKELKRQLDSRKARGERVTIATKKSFGEALLEWYGSVEGRLRPETRNNYETVMGKDRGGNGHAHLRALQRFGELPLSRISTNLLAEWVRDMEAAGFSASWIREHVKPVSMTFKYAIRKGWATTNPATALDHHDLPPTKLRPLVLLNETQVTKLLDAAAEIGREPTSRYDYSALLTLAAFTGLRLSEVLGLCWRRVDLTDGYLHVREQLSRAGALESLKTSAGSRDVKLGKGMTQYLRELKASSRYSQPSDPVFASRTGGFLKQRNVQRRGFDRALERAGLDELDPRPTFHDLRHVAASRWIASGLDVVVVANQLGHSDSTVTLRRYAGLWDRAAKDALLEAAMDSAWDSSRATPRIHRGHDRRPNAPSEEAGKVASLRRS